MSRPTNVGLVGLSTTGWARVLEPALLSLGDTYRIVAVSTTNAASAQASAARLTEQTKYPVKAYFGDTSQIASDPDVEFVIVAVKAPQHKQALLPVIQAKKHLSIEWPVGRNLEETQELANAARESGVRSLVGLQGRQSPILNRAKELIASGKIGKMLSCSVIGATHQELLCWGPLVEQSIAYYAPHFVHRLTFLHVLGSKLASVTATTSTLYPTVTLTQEDGTPTDETVTATAPDHIALHRTLANAALLSMSFHGGYKSTPGRHQLVWIINGDAGSIRVEGVGPGGAFAQICPPKLYLDDEEIVFDSGNYPQGILASQFAEFAKGEEGRYATMDDAVKTRRVLDAVAQSGDKKVNL